jgi:hypothetical protein
MLTSLVAKARHLGGAAVIQGRRGVVYSFPFWRQVVSAKPCRTPRVPKLRVHRASGRGYVSFKGRWVYLGLASDPETLKRYNQLIDEWLAAGRQSFVSPGQITVKELLARFWQHANAKVLPPDAPRPLAAPPPDRGGRRSPSVQRRHRRGSLGQAHHSFPLRVDLHAISLLLATGAFIAHRESLRGGVRAVQGRRNGGTTAA